jgi:hypothetical protein
MRRALDQFKVNIERTKELSQTVSAINRITTSAVDLSDFLRAEIVSAVSALDYFVHEYVRIGMIEIYKGNRIATDAYYKFPIPLKSAHLVKINITDEQWLDEVIRTKHSWLSFQDPDRIADAIRLISPVSIWDVVGRAIGESPGDIKAHLKIIVDRRNKIAHEADMDPTSPNTRWPINKEIAEDAVNYIQKIVEAIYDITIA